jgi:hypothetical protein
MTTRPSQFERWWTQTATADAAATATKAREYGSHDLFEVGKMLAEFADQETDDAARNFEMGCLFYLYGKITRAISAYQSGRTCSDDTWFDMAIYAKMALANRAGVWGQFEPEKHLPGAPTDFLSSSMFGWQGPTGWQLEQEEDEL